MLQARTPDPLNSFFGLSLCSLLVLFFNFFSINLSFRSPLSFTFLSFLLSSFPPPYFRCRTYGIFPLQNLWQIYRLLQKYYVKIQLPKALDYSNEKTAKVLHRVTKIQNVHWKQSTFFSFWNFSFQKQKLDFKQEYNIEIKLKCSFTESCH